MGNLISLTDLAEQMDLPIEEIKNLVFKHRCRTIHLIDEHYAITKGDAALIKASVLGLLKTESYV